MSGRRQRQRPRYPVDPTVRAVRESGAASGWVEPPDGHPRRCQARSRRMQRQCRKWALQGRRFCPTHGTKPLYRNANVRGYYSQNAGPRLRQVLEELRTAPPEERMSLADEIDLARMLTERHVRIFEATCVGEQSDKASDELKAAAIAGLRRALSHVSDMVTKAAKVRALHDGTVDAEGVDYIVAQVVKIVEDEIRDKDPSMADRVVARMEQIRLPQNTRTATIEIR